MGFAPLIGGRAALQLAMRSPIGDTLHRLWLPLTFVAMAWMLAFPLWVVRRRGVSLARPTPRRVLKEGLVAALVVPVVLVSMVGFTSLSAYLLGPAATPTPYLEPIAASSRRLDWMSLVVLAVVVAPVAEEVFFRGMLYNALRQWLRPLLAAPIQAAIFALGHPFGLLERAIVATVGVLLALLYERRRTLVAPMILHASLNMAALGVMFWAVAADANTPRLGVALGQHESGCLITAVLPRGAAEAAGLRIGDVINGAGDYAVANRTHLFSVLRMKKAGDSIPVYFLRDGEQYQVDVVLKASPMSP